MRILIAAIGRARDRPAAALYEHYAARLTAWRLELREIEVRRRLPPDRLRAAEGQALLAAPAPGAVIVALDQGGEVATTAAFVARLARWQDGAVPEVAFLIGGAEGLDPAVGARAHWVLALGRMTWPHLMVRAMLAEQLYRAQQILAGHPYHRA